MQRSLGTSLARLKKRSDPPVNQVEIDRFRADLARHVTVYVFHNNVHEWLEKVDRAIEIAREDGEHEDYTSSILRGMSELSLDQWFLIDGSIVPPSTIWDRVLQQTQTLKGAIARNKMTAGYHEQRTRPLILDQVCIEEALQKVASMYDQCNRKDTR